MESLYFSLNATVPVFMLMVFGMLLRKIGWMSEDFANQLNKFVFLFPLPVSLFKSMASSNLDLKGNSKFLIYCVIASLLGLGIAFIISYFFIEDDDQGEFIQASCRGNSALIGMAILNNIYTNSVFGPLMIAGSAIVYNIFSVIILTVLKPGEREKINRKVLKKVFRGITHNPIIIGILSGIIWSLLKLPYTGMFAKTVDYVASTASPMGLMAMGALFSFKKAAGKIKPLMIAVSIKLFALIMIFLPVGAALGYRDDALVALAIMLGSSTAVSSYTMAKNMGHEGTISSSMIMVTTILCGFTITLWIFIMRSFQLI